MKSYIDAHAQEIGKPIGLSEYGAGGNPAQHQEGPPQKVDNKGPFHPEEYQDYVHEVDWAQIQNNPNVWGSFIWAMFDFSSAKRNEGGAVGVNDKGLVTQDRKIKKDAFYFYKANWTSAPMVYIASRRMTPRKVATTEVKVYSNCAEVALTVNGRSLGAVKPDGERICRWENVTLAPGENRVDAVGTGAGERVTDSCGWTLAP
jgi:beta-galactosidase